MTANIVRILQKLLLNFSIIVKSKISPTFTLKRHISDVITDYLFFKYKIQHNIRHMTSRTIYQTNKSLTRKPFSVFLSLQNIC